MSREKYYAVFYDKQFHVGRMIAEEGEEYYEFKFLHKVCNPSARLFDWPARPDIDTVHRRFIIHGPLVLVGMALSKLRTLIK